MIANSAGLPATCSVLVVGGGMAGLELAKELERNGVSGVLVLEAGPGDELRHVNAAQPKDAALRTWLRPGADSHFRRPWKSHAAPHYVEGSGIRQRLGGRSLYWYGVAMPMEPWALTEPSWPASVVADLTVTWQGGDSLYTRIADMLNEWRGAGGTGETLVDDSLHGTIGDIHLTAAPLAVRASQQHADRWYAYSPLDIWRDPDSGETLRAPQGIGFATGVEVREVITRDGEACGVVARRAGADGYVEVRAKVVVLCAGTLENSRLAATAMSPVEPVRLPGLFDHIVHGVFLRLQGDYARKALDALPSGWYAACCEPAARSNLYIDVSELGPDDVLFELRVTGEQLPSAENYVECGDGEVTVHAALSAQDREVVALQRDILQEVWDGISGIVGCPPAHLGFGDFDDPAQTNAAVLPESVSRMASGVPVVWSSHLGTEDHEGGTLALGTVLNDDHEFHAVRRLYAAGPSTFPRLGAADPSFTTLALAHRLAAALAQRLRG